MTSYDIKRTRLCSICKKSFSKSSDLVTHLRIHAGKCPTHNCLLCNKAFSRKNALDSHMSVHKCSVRLVHIINWNDNGTSRKLAKGQTRGKKYKCLTCGKACASMLDLQRHANIHTGEKSYQCRLCKNTFLHKSSLLRHMRTIHSRNLTLKCPVCEKQLHNRRDLKMHLKVHTGKQPHTCSVCDRIFTLKSSLVCHKRVHAEKTINKCAICERAFDYTSSLKRHIALTHRKKKLCNEKSLPAATFHRNNSAKMLVRVDSKCKFCYKTFSNLQNHMKVHFGERLYSCSVCPKSFSLHLSLQRHLKLHMQKQKLHKCLVCNKVFTLKANLEAHMNIHTKAQCGQCPTCKKMYLRSDFLKRHVIKCHAKTEERKRPIRRKRPASRASLFNRVETKSADHPFCCSICYRTFSCSRIFNRHVTLHERASFKCSVCNKLFSRSSSLAKHFQSFHDEKKSKEKVVKKRSKVMQQFDQNQASERIFEELKNYGEIIEMTEMF